MSILASRYLLFFRQAGKHHIARLLSVALLVVTGVLAVNPMASGQERQSIGKLGAIIGKVYVVRDGQQIPASKDFEVLATDKLVTEKKSVAKIVFKDGGTFMAFEDSAITIEEYSLKKKGDKLSLKSAFDIAKGKVRFFVKPGEKRENDATYRTKNAVMGIRGTSGFIDATTPGKTELVVTTGKVELSNPANPGASVLVPADHVSSILGNGPPSVPKPAPAELLGSLNSEVGSVSGEGPSGESEGGSEEAVPEESSGGDDGGSGPTGSDDGSAPSQESGSQESSEQPASESVGAGSNDSAGDGLEGGSTDANEPSAGSSPSGSADRSELPGEKAQDAPQEQRPAAQPVVKRVQVFGEDGSGTVSVSDQSMGQLNATSKGVGVAPPALRQAPDLNKATEKMIKDVKKAVNPDKVVDKVEETVEKAVDKGVPEVEAVKAPLKKSVKIKVVLPQ